MGIIQRQSIRQTVINYAATAVGAISTLFIYPRAEAMYGLALFLTGTATFLYPFASLGITSLAVRFFPAFEDKARGHYGFLGVLLLGVLTTFAIFLLGIELMAEPGLDFLALLHFDTGPIRQYALPIITLSIIVVLSVLLTNYISNFGRIVIPGVFNNLLPKLALPVLILLIAAQWIDTATFVNGVIAYHLLALAGLFAYLGRLGELHLRPEWSFFNRKQVGRMAEYSLYGMLGSLGSIFAFRIDYIMVTMMASLSNTGIYGIAQFIGNSIEMPTRSVFAVAGPIIARAWREQDFAEIEKIYKKASLNLLLVGLLIFIAMWLSIDDLFRLTPRYDTLMQARYVVLFVSLGKLIDMATSVNSEIIGYSRYFRFNLVAVLLLGVGNAILNYLLIPRFGITGAALATTISLTLFNLAKIIFIYFKLRIHPFTRNTLRLLLLAAAVLALVGLAPDTGYPLVDIAKNCVLTGLLFLGPALYFDLAPDITQVVRDYRKRVREWLGR